MGTVIDITRDFPEGFETGVKITEVELKSNAARYTGMVYDWPAHSMHGSYIDFPGHIKETDNGERADNFPHERLYRVPCSVIRLNRKSGSGGVSANDLEKAFGGIPDTPALLINALGKKEPDEVESRSVFLEDGALDWIIASGARMIVSDIYESQALHGVFLRLFEAGISTVCEPRGLCRIKDSRVFLTVLFEKIPVVTQIPCRIIAETLN